MVVCGKATVADSLTGRVLVLGKKQVGKSATIVRYTTGRFIGTYGNSTSDWLYRHWLGYDESRQLSTTIELLEQEDVTFECGANLFNNNYHNNNSTTTTSSPDEKTHRPSTTSLPSKTLISNNLEQQDGPKSPAKQRSLSCRVAMDSERNEKIDLLNRIQWAHAYVVMYAINDFESYEKAIRYLNLIAQTNYGNIYTQHQHQNQKHSQNSNNSTSSERNNSISSDSNVPDKQHQQQNRPSSSGSVGAANAKQQTGASLSNLSTAASSTSSLGGVGGCVRKPILLVANKSDLAPSGGRKVSTSEGRNLALRHHAMFCELSVSKSQIEIEAALNHLFESIELQSLIASPRHKLFSRCTEPQNNNNNSSNHKLRRPTTDLSNFDLDELDGDDLDELNDVFLINEAELSLDGACLPDINVSSTDCFTGIHSNPLNHQQHNNYTLAASNFDNANNIHGSNNSIKPPSGASQGPRSPSNGSRYKSLKSSFKRASMAIVSSRTLLNNSSNNGCSTALSKSSNSINISSSQKQTISPPKHASYNLQPNAAGPIPLNHQNKTNSIDWSATTAISVAVGDQQPSEVNSDQQMLLNSKSDLGARGDNKYQSDTSLNKSTKKNKKNGSNPNSNCGSNNLLIEITNNKQPQPANNNKHAGKGSKESLKESGAYYSGLVSERLKRTIMKYKTRRKTVATVCKSAQEDAGEGLLLEEEPEPAKWSTDSSNSLKSLDSNKLAPNSNTNGKQKAPVKAKDGANLDRSRSALNKGDKLYYRSIFGIQRPLNNSNKQHYDSTQINASVCSQTNMTSQDQISPYRPGSSSSSSIFSGQSSSGQSLSISPTPTLAKQRHLDDSLSIGSSLRDKSLNDDQYLANAPSGPGMHRLVTAIANSEPVAVSHTKKHSTVRNVMNSFTRRPTTCPKQADSNKGNKQTSSANNSTKKPLYAGIFGNSNLVITPPVVYKRTVEMLPINVAYVEKIEVGHKGEKNFASQTPVMNTGFCHQL